MALSGRGGGQGDVLLWVRAVATALVAALVMRISFAPAGVLAETTTPSRAAALAAGIGAYYLLGRVEWGVAVTVATLAFAEVAVRPFF